MKILKEKIFYAFRWQDADADIAFAILEDGTWLLVHDNGTASTPEGTVYYHVGREVESVPALSDMPWTDDLAPPPTSTTVMEDLGWTTDARTPMYFPLNADEAIESTMI